MKTIEKINYTNYKMSMDYYRLAMDVMDRIDIETINDIEDEDERCEALSDQISSAIDSVLIYTHNIWTVIQEYFNPKDIDGETYNTAIQYFFDDIESNIDIEYAEQ